MAEKCRHGSNSIHGRNIITEIKTQFHLLTITLRGSNQGSILIQPFKKNRMKTEKTLFLAYCFMFVFIFFTVFIAFNPSSNSCSLWFTNILCIESIDATNNTTNTLSLLSNEIENEYEISSLFSHFISNTSTQIRNFTTHSSTTTNISDSQSSQFVSPYAQNANLEEDKVDILKHDHVEVPALKTSSKSHFAEKFTSGNGRNRTEEKGSSLKNQSNATEPTAFAKKERDDLIKSLMNCDLYDGNWVRDKSYPLYKPGSCSLIDEQFNCFINGRPDNRYQKLRWKPNGCTLPRINGSHMLDLLSGKRLVFVGDSLNRNMWESLVCILKNSVKDQKKVYEASGKVYCRTEVSYSFVFEDYNFTVEFFVSPFLVQEWEIRGKNGEKKETLRLDMVGKSADSYKDADILVFNTGHWWTHEKTSLGKDYYQEGRRVHRELNVLEAFRRALTTWGRWIDANINATRSLVLFRGYSASHFSGGQWNSGGACDNETHPIKNDAYLSKYPDKMRVLESVFTGMKTNVSYMNVTRMTDYRKDGHPSVYRKKNLTEEERRLSLSIQDCSHWCLPGVPDLWNEILYAELLLNGYRKQQPPQKRLLVFKKHG